MYTRHGHYVVEPLKVPSLYRTVYNRHSHYSVKFLNSCEVFVESLCYEGADFFRNMELISISTKGVMMLLDLGSD